MPFSIRKSKKIAPGTRVNLSKKGVSMSTGAGGVRFSTGKSGSCLYTIVAILGGLMLCGLLQQCLGNAYIP